MLYTAEGALGILWWRIIYVMSGWYVNYIRDMYELIIVKFSLLYLNTYSRVKYWDFNFIADPDYPTNENRKDAEKLYWLVINIPKNHICDGKSLVPYLGCRPGLNTGNLVCVF